MKTFPAFIHVAPLPWQCLVAGALGTAACSSHSEKTPAVNVEQVARGEALFRDRILVGLHGNGRACSDCHMDSSGFQLSPASAEARFQQMRASGVDDPLFRPVDADDLVLNGNDAADYSNLRQNGLIRIRMPLPENIKLVDPASCTTAGMAASCESAATYLVSRAAFTDVWRSVPSVLNVDVSGPDARSSPWPRDPNPEGGYQLDARVDTLQSQARGALLGHAEVSTAPDAQILDDIAAYEKGLHANSEPPLDALETQGKAIFDRACGQCHNGPGMSSPIPGVLRFIDDLTACPRPVDPVSPARWNLAPCPPELSRNVQTYEISFADGFKRRRTSTDPGRALLTGFVFSGPPLADGSCAHSPCGPDQKDDWQKFDVAPLHGISKTSPYFHNNSEATLEDVVIHYEEFFKRVAALADPAAGVPPVLTTDGVQNDRPNVPSERPALVAYLKKL